MLNRAQINKIKYYYLLIFFIFWLLFFKNENLIITICLQQLQSDTKSVGCPFLFFLKKVKGVTIKLSSLKTNNQDKRNRQVIIFNFNILCGCIEELCGHKSRG